MHSFRHDLALAACVGLVCAAGLALVLTPLWQSGDLVLAFNDGNIEIVLSPVFSYPESLTRIWDDHFYFGRGDVGYGIAGFSALETLLGPWAYRRVGPLLIALLLGAAGFWLSRQLGRSRPAGAVAGVFLGLCGWTATATLSGLFGRPLAMLWAALALGVLERAERPETERPEAERSKDPEVSGRSPARRRWLGYLLAGGLLGLAVAETADVGAFFALALAAWWLLALRPLDRLHRGWRRHLPLFAALVVASALIASHTIWKMADTELAAGLAAEQSTEAAWDWATQWSLPVSETLSLAVPGFHGTSSRSEDSPYWGELGRTPGWQPGAGGWRNFKLNGYFIGTAATLLLIFLAFELRRKEADLAAPERRRAVLALGIAAAALALAWGRFFLVYRFFHALPFMNTIRNPEKWLGPMALFVAIGIAYGVDLLIRRFEVPDPHWGRRLDAVGLLAAVLLLLAFGVLTPGGGDLAPADVVPASSAGQRAVLAALVVIGGLMVLRRLALRVAAPKRAWTVAGGLAALIAGQLLFATKPYVEKVDASYLSRPSPLQSALDDLGPGRVKLLPPRQIMLNNWRQTYLASRGTPLFDPISVRALPEGEARFFAALQEKTVDSWRLAGVRYFLASQEAMAELDGRRDFSVLESRRADDWDPRFDDPNFSTSPRLTAASREPIHLVELTTAKAPLRLVQRWTEVRDDPAGDAQVLQQLAAPEFDAAEARFVHGSTTSIRSLNEDLKDSEVAIIATSSSPTHLEATVQGPGLLLRASRFDPRWRVRIDGQDAPLLRANYLFQAVEISAGEHQVIFEFEPPKGLFYFSIAGRLGLLALTFVFFRFPRQVESA